MTLRGSWKREHDTHEGRDHEQRKGVREGGG